MAASIVFVHGTGVRLKNYRQTFDTAAKCARQAGIHATFVECAWGDPLGVEFEGKSLPDPPSAAKLKAESEDFAQWQWLYADPLFEIDKLTLRDTAAETPIPMPGQRPEWEQLWDKIEAYQPSDDLNALLQRGGLTDLWPNAWAQIITLSAIPRQAFEASAAQLAEPAQALARALAAQLNNDALAAGRPGLSRTLRNSIVDRLIDDWGMKVYGLSDFFPNLFKRAVTKMLRGHREGLSDAAALPIGDILLYQARAPEVQDFIRKKIDHAPKPVSVIAHSLGGIATVDLLALPNPPQVTHLITVGSQAPLLYELGALNSMKNGQNLPATFPHWLNIFDRNDFLSYVAHRLFPAADDKETESGQPFPDSHSAYFANPEVWREVAQFLARPPK